MNSGAFDMVAGPRKQPSGNDSNEFDLHGHAVLWCADGRGSPHHGGIAEWTRVTEASIGMPRPLSTRWMGLRLSSLLRSGLRTWGPFVGSKWALHGAVWQRRINSLDLID